MYVSPFLRISYAICSGGKSARIACNFCTCKLIRSFSFQLGENSRTRTIFFLLNYPTKTIQEPKKMKKKRRLYQIVWLANRLRPSLLASCSVQVGYDKQGLPIGLQLLGRPWAEASILRLAAAIEVLAPFHLKLNKRGLWCLN